MNILDEVKDTLLRIEKRLDSLEKRDNETYVNVAEASKILGCGWREVYRKAKGGILPYKKFGGVIKFKKSDLL